MQSWFIIELNGASWRHEDVSVHTSLLDGLKACGQVDVLTRADSEQGGAWVLMLDVDRDRRPVLRTIDAVQVPLLTMAGKQIWTRKGLQRHFSEHPLWAVEKDYPGLDSHPLRRDNLLLLLFEWCALTVEQKKVTLPEDFISRTADYAAVKKMIEVLLPVESYGAARLGEDRVEAGDAVQYVDADKNRFYRPLTIVDLFELKNQAAKGKVVAGGITAAREPASVRLSVESIGELRAVVDEGSHWQIGSAVPLTEIVEVLGDEYPELGKTLQRYASGPLRNRMTLGGQLNTSSGRAELGPVLLALEARVRLASEGGARDLTVQSFFARHEEGALRHNEIIKSVSVPRDTAEMLRVKDCEQRVCEAYKISLRSTACPALISAAFALELDEEKKVKRAILAYGGLIEQPVLAVKAAAALKGKVWDQQAVIAVLKNLDEEIALLGKLDEKDGRRLWVSTLLQKFQHQYASLQKRKADEAEAEVRRDLAEEGEGFFKPVDAD